MSLSTGLDRVDLSLEELNICLEFNERSKFWVDMDANYSISCIDSQHYSIFINLQDSIGITRGDSFRRFRREKEANMEGAAGSSPFRFDGSHSSSSPSPSSPSPRGSGFSWASAFSPI